MPNEEGEKKIKGEAENITTGAERKEEKRPVLAITRSRGGEKRKKSVNRRSWNGMRGGGKKRIRERLEVSRSASRP